MLSNWTDYRLIELCNSAEATGHLSNLLRVYDEELDLRQPDIAAWYFGDCAGKLIFIPIELEYDSEGQPVVSEAIGCSDEGEQVWITN